MGEDSEDENMDSDILELMKQMDKDLENTCLNESFERENASQNVDIDFNLIKNFLASYSEQNGLPGPVSNLLNHLNIGKK